MMIIGNNRKVRNRAALISMVGFLSSANALAAPSSLGIFGDWQALTYTTADTKVCYIVSQPVQTLPKGVKRDPAFFLISHMPGRKVQGEISAIMGYNLKKESTVALKIGAQEFTLFTNADGAWSDSVATERKIVASLRNADKFTVKGVSGRGRETSDTYSLRGVSTALEKIDAACK